MFVIVRMAHGETEILKDSNSVAAKTFIELSEAHLLAQKLNENTVDEMKWSVQQRI